MFIDKIAAKTKDGDFNVIIEIPMNMVKNETPNSLW